MSFGEADETFCGDESAWTPLERDFRSPFDDERPPLVYEFWK